MGTSVRPLVTEGPFSETPDIRKLDVLIRRFAVRTSLRE